MINIDLNVITEIHLSGKWEIQASLASNGLLSDDHPSEIFMRHRFMEILSSGHFMLTNGKSLKGTWDLLRQNEIIYNPQLVFYLNKEEIGNTIITRFYKSELNGDRVERMILYFNSGLELILKKTITENQMT